MNVLELHDRDQVEAFTPEREALWARLQSVTFITDDEKRTAAGYGPALSSIGPTAPRRRPFQVEVQKYSPDQPRVPAGNSDGGQWTSGGGGSDLGNPQREAGLRDILRNLLKSPKVLKPSETPLHELLKPGGKELGTKLKSVGDGIRTLTKKEYEALKSQLLDGALEIPAPTGFRGKWYQRPDGSKIAVRLSPRSGETLEVVESMNKSLLKNGYKVHFK